MTPEELFEAHRPWAISIAQAEGRRMGWDSHEREDGVQEALVALWLAAKAYNPIRSTGPKGLGFRTFCYKRVIGSAVDYQRRMDRRYISDKRQGLKPISGHMPTMDTTRLIGAPGEDSLLKRMEVKEEVHSILSGLSLKEQEIYKAVTLGEELKSVAQRHGIGTTRVLQIQNKVALKVSRKAQARKGR